MKRPRRSRRKCFERWVWKQFDSPTLQFPVRKEPNAPAMNKHLHSAAAAINIYATCLPRTHCKMVSFLVSSLRHASSTMAWNVSLTVLTSVFGSTILVSALYFIHAYLIPHLRRPKQEPDVTLPRTQAHTNPRLRESLYSLPSLNYIDPRNSVADTELRSSRWSTNLQDLSRSPSAMSLALSRSPRIHFSAFSHPSVKSPVHGRNSSTSTTRQLSPQNTAKVQKAALQVAEGGQRRRTKPPAPMCTPASGKSHRNQRFSRPRSTSDTAVFFQEGLLARSHAVFFEPTDAADTSSPTISTFSGTTLLSSPETPQARMGRGRDTRRGRSRSLAGHHRFRSLSGSNQAGVDVQLDA